MTTKLPLSTAERQKLVKEQMAHNRLLSKRRGIEVPDVSLIENDQVKSEFNLKGFDLVCDLETRQAVYDALCSNSYSDIARSIADVFATDLLHVCIISTKKAVRNGEKCRIIKIRNGFSAGFNEFLKSVLAGRFDGPTRCWSVVANGISIEALNDTLFRYFSVVVDIDTLSVYKGSEQPELRMPARAENHTLPQVQCLSFKEIKDALGSIRPGDYIELNTIWVHDGVRFIKVHPGRGVKFNLESALFRFGVPGGQLRYISFLVLNPGVNTVAFGQDKKVGALIGKYVESCPVGIPAALVEENPSGAEEKT